MSASTIPSHQVYDQNNINATFDGPAQKKKRRVQSNASDAFAQEQKKPAQCKDLMNQKRERDAKISTTIGIATSCIPSKYPLYHAPTKSVASMMLRYIQNLQQNDCVARPGNWSRVINKKSYQKDHSQLNHLEHIWNSLHCTHYIPVTTSDGFQSELDNGLLLPVLISPISQFGQQISVQTPWPQESLQSLLHTILTPASAQIEVQDHGKTRIDKFTIPKTCKSVQARFDTPFKDRGPAWNCLEVKDCLPGFKGPKPLEFGASLRQWQFEDHSPSSKNRAEISVSPSAKHMDQWLLVSEANSGSFAHVDVGLGTWISCLKGKKTFWLRNPTIRDQRVWENFDVDNDHRSFTEPWGRVDLLPGSVL